MTPLEAARKMAASTASWCESPDHFSQQHKPDCPWLAAPKIVAALEAVQGLIQTVDQVRRVRAIYPERIEPADSLIDCDDDGDVVTCYGCAVELDAHGREEENPHAPECHWLKLLSLFGIEMKGEPE